MNEDGCNVRGENRRKRKRYEMKCVTRRSEEVEREKRFQSDGRLLPKAKSAAPPPVLLFTPV